MFVGVFHSTTPNRMAAEQRKPSTERTIGLVPCPRCRGGMKSCKLCGGAGRVAVDVAVSWTVEHGSQPSQPAPAPRAPSEDDTLLLNSLNDVLEKLGQLEDQEATTELVTRANDLRVVIENWPVSAPSKDARDEVSKEILGLHVALGRLTRGGK